MRVGMIAPVAWRTPPVHYGPTELVTSLLTEGQVRRGSTSPYSRPRTP
jgi:hypothetical protein